MCVSHFLYLFICWWTLRLIPYFGYCKQCCSEHGGAYIFFKWVFLFSSGKCRVEELLDHMVILFLIFWGTYVFHSGCISLHSHWACTRVSFFPHSHQLLVLHVLLIIVFLTRVKWYLTVVLIFISLVINEVEYVFLYLEHAICMSSLEKMSIQIICNQIACFSAIELYELFLYFEYLPLIRYMVYKYFLPFSKFPFNFVYSFSVQKLLSPTCLILL